MTNEFGKNCMYIICSFIGELPQEKCGQVLLDVVEAAGMRPSHDPHTWEYPGNIGYIMAQPLIESFCCIDYWPCHNGGFMMLDSCKPFHPNLIAKALEKAGLTVYGQRIFGLDLP